jgi:hypothetical protein
MRSLGLFDAGERRGCVPVRAARWAYTFRARVPIVLLSSQFSKSSLDAKPPRRKVRVYTRYRSCIHVCPLGCPGRGALGRGSTSPSVATSHLRGPRDGPRAVQCDSSPLLSVLLLLDACLLLSDACVAEVVAPRLLTVTLVSDKLDINNMFSWG